MFEADEDKTRAVLFALGKIGEAIADLDEAQRQSLSDAGVPVQRVRDMRNLIVHEYWRTDLEIVYNVASQHLAPLLAAVEGLLTLSSPPPSQGVPSPTGNQPGGSGGESKP